MIKFILILFIGLVFESTGIVFLKKGMNQLGEIKAVSVGAVAKMVKAGVTNAYILMGIFFQALFFACLLILMSKCDITFLWPMTALTFVFSTIAAMLFLHEHPSPSRWIGIVFIMIGAAFISYSEHAKEKPAHPATSQVDSSSGK